MPLWAETILLACMLAARLPDLAFTHDRRLVQLMSRPSAYTQSCSNGISVVKREHVVTVDLDSTTVNFR